jgi:hypothetical protein
MSEAKELSRLIDEKILSFINANIKPAMGQLEKQREIHKYIQATVTHNEHDISRDSFSVVGALVHGHCVCEGFAKAYKLLCDYLKIATIVITGKSNKDDKQELHAWNIVRINNVTAHNDITWDAIAGAGSYAYFNLSDAEISVDHIFKPDFFPACGPNKINYFYLNNLVAANENEARKIIAANADKTGFSVKFLYPVEFEQIARLGFQNGNIICNSTQNVVMFKKER